MQLIWHPAVKWSVLHSWLHFDFRWRCFSTKKYCKHCAWRTTMCLFFCYIRQDGHMLSLTDLSQTSNAALTSGVQWPVVSKLYTNSHALYYYYYHYYYYFSYHHYYYYYYSLRCAVICRSLEMLVWFWADKSRVARSLQRYYYSFITTSTITTTVITTTTTFTYFNL